MNDKNRSIQQLQDAVADFVSEREWNKFHSLKNLSMDIAVEASELMELFLWVDNAASDERFAQKRDEVEQEVADIFIALLAFCNRADIDLVQAFDRKLQLTKEKYPVSKVKGKSNKYTEYK